jgi:DinB superfamily
MRRPDPSEHIPYYGKYIVFVEEGEDVLTLLEKQPRDLQALFASVPEDRGGYCYESGKWSLREVLGHLVDVERVLGFRAYCFSRGESQPLPGVDFESYAATGEHDRRTLAEMLQEFEGLRRSHAAMFRALGEEASRRIGTADGNPISVRSLAYILAGHVRYHAQLLKERYGVDPSPPSSKPSRC